MKNYNDCVQFAKNDMNLYGCVGFVIIKTNPETVFKWGKMGIDVTYDYVLFSSWNEMKKFINGQYSYDYIDNSQILDNDDKIIYGFVRGQINSKKTINIKIS